jgi:hypothetical protein
VGQMERIVSYEPVVDEDVDEQVELGVGDTSYVVEADVAQADPGELEGLGPPSGDEDADWSDDALRENGAPLGHQGASANSRPIPRAFESTGDPVRMFLRDVGDTALLTREDEIALAQRFETAQEPSWRGFARVRQPLPRSLPGTTLCTMGASNSVISSKLMPLPTT